jgi:hypothetical protein
MENAPITIWSLNFPFCFGKHKGKKLSEVLEKDVQYLVWMKNTITFYKFSEFVEKKIDEKIHGKDFLDVLDTCITRYHAEKILETKLLQERQLKEKYKNQNKNACIVAEFMIEMQIRENLKKQNNEKIYKLRSNQNSRGI